MILVCENGHFLGKRGACPCGGSVGAGKKISLFLPLPLHKELAADADTMDESISAQIVRLIIRARSRKVKRAHSR